MNRELLLQVANDLVAVGASVLATRDVNPEVFAVGSLEDELVKVNMTFQPVEPLAGGF